MLQGAFFMLIYFGYSVFLCAQQKARKQIGGNPDWTSSSSTFSTESVKTTVTVYQRQLVQEKRDKKTELCTRVFDRVPMKNKSSYPS